MDTFLKEGKMSRVEKAVVYAERRFQWEVMETNNNKILVYILVDVRHYSKHFTYINSFTPYIIL